MPEVPKVHPVVAACIDRTLDRVGKRILLGTPLGIGKANHLVNGFYHRAVEDPELDLTIFTALSLGAPRWSSDLERRFVQPLAERLFPGYPELAYVDPFRKGELPPNIRVREFYFRPGAYMGSPLAQQAHVGSNYTHVVRDLLDQGINVLAQLVGKEVREGHVRYSLGSNPDLTVDLVPSLRKRRARGEEVALLGEVNPEMPFMVGDAEVEEGYFDEVIDESDLHFPLFGVPNRPVEMRDYAVALHVSTLIRDGGTLQIGIGSLGDAITQVLRMRHEENPAYLEAVEAASIPSRYADLVERVGGTGPFEEGLYAGSEMLVDGFLKLRRSGVLSRKVYASEALQRLLNEGTIEETVSWEMVEALVEAGALSPQPDAEDLAFLQKFRIFQKGIRWDDQALVLDEGTRVPADFAVEETREVLRKRGLGTRLEGGHVAHACFFLGPRAFYEELRTMDPEERRLIGMTGISWVNQLYGSEALKRLQRREARFVNTGMIVTLGGAVASDGIDDGRVVSGVGGQYNFVAMAHELDDGRSILMIPATSDRGGDLTSNLRVTYAHTTIPRHLKDLVVTEYGIADLRGRTDGEVARALLAIADSRFQDALLEEAKEAGMIEDGYVLPDAFRGNTPEALHALFDPFRARGFFERFPSGTELTEEELVLKKALSVLDAARRREEIPLPGLRQLRDVARVPEAARPYLERMDLHAPGSASERAMQRLVVFGLSTIGAL